MIQISTAAPSRIGAGDVQTHSLGRRAMTVELHLSAWGAQRVDREMSNDINRRQGSAPDAGKWQKLLVPESALEAVTKAHRHANARHRALTLPWGEKNRIISATAFLDYSAAMGEERASCERAHQEFVAVYPSLVKTAPDRMKGAYREADFPAVAVIAQRFAFRLEVLPVADHGDFRLDLGDEIEEQIRRDIEQTLSARQAEAQRDLWTRVLTTVRHFAETMAEERKTFQRTTVTNLTEIATLAPKLALDHDPLLESICADILAITDACDPESLRASRKVRSKAAEDAAEAVRRIEHAIQGAF